MKISFTVNGTEHTGETDAGELLIEHLRDVLGLTAAKIGCDTGQCGACTVRVDGRAVKSCLMLTAQADGADVHTVEGEADGDELSPLQSCLLAEHATQCGFCTPGVVMSLSDLLEHNPEPTEAEARNWLKGNLCRCTGYHSIVRGVQRAATGQGGRS